MKKFSLTIVFFVVFITYGVSQETLTVENAIAIAIKENYDIRIAKNNIDIAEEENSIWNRGFLPRISATAGVNYRDETQNVVFADGGAANVEGAITESYNASATAEYTLFDGLERKFNNDKLQENFALSSLQERQQIENTVISVYDVYYNVAFQKQVVDNLLLNIENSTQRLKRAQTALKYGQGSKLDELNAEVDLKNDSITYASAQRDLANLKRNLNLTLGREVTTPFNIDTAVIIEGLLNKDQLLQDVKSKNIQSQLAEKNLLLSELDVKINKAKFLPKLQGSAGYNWFESQNPPTSFALRSETYGINLGLNLSWNIFDGGKNRTRIKTAQIRQDSREIELFKAQEQLRADFFNAFETYENAIYTLEAESKNLETNELNFQRTLSQLKAGQTTSIEYRQAQINLFNARTNLARAKYDVKVAEINLLQLSGNLLE